MGAAIVPALMGIGSFLSSAAPVIGAVGSIAGPLIAANGQKQAAAINAQGQARLVGGQGGPTPGGQLIGAGGAQDASMQAGALTPTGGGGEAYKGGGSRYNSAQTLSTAPSLSGTGSGFNGASLIGQPQPGQTGVQ